MRQKTETNMVAELTRDAFNHGVFEIGLNTPGDVEAGSVEEGAEFRFRPLAAPSFDQHDQIYSGNGAVERASLEAFRQYSLDQQQSSVARHCAATVHKDRH